MAKKVKTENPIEEQIPEIEEPIYVPDIPAQAKEENTVVHTDVVETESNFLKRILHIQHSGGFGRHLDELINERLKILQ